MTATVAGSKFQFGIASIGGTWSWAVQANNTFGAGQLYQFVDIVTPFGPLMGTGVDIPIPADVIECMASSLVDVRAQLAPLLALVQPATTSFNLVIVEGDPNQEVGDVEVQNVGAFGSFMEATATPDAVWLAASPSVVQGIGKNQKDSFNISLLPSTLLSANSPFNGTVNLQENREPPTIIPLSVTVTVLPRPAISTDVSSMVFSYSVSTGVPSGANAVTISNTGPLLSVLDWAAAVVNGAAWLAIVPTSGGPLNPGDTSIVTASLVASAIPLSPGVYSDKIRISSPTASNSPVDVNVTLTVTA